MTRGFNEEDALTLIVNGFMEPFTKELPMEYAVELETDKIWNELGQMKDGTFGQDGG